MNRVGYGEIPLTKNNCLTGWLESYFLNRGGLSQFQQQTTTTTTTGTVVWYSIGSGSTGRGMEQCTVQYRYRGTGTGTTGTLLLAFSTLLLRSTLPVLVVDNYSRCTVQYRGTTGTGSSVHYYQLSLLSSQTALQCYQAVLYIACSTWASVVIATVEGGRLFPQRGNTSWPISNWLTQVIAQLVLYHVFAEIIYEYGLFLSNYCSKLGTS